MSNTAKRVGSLALCVAAVMTALTAGVAQADPERAYVGGRDGVDIRVWVDDTWDVHPSYAEVTFSVRASRDCFATIFVIDTDGYVHVVHPSSRRGGTRLRQGRTYSFSGIDLGLYRLQGRGISYVFAVGSPDRFEFDRWGDTIFVGSFGYRIYGDPYVACRQLYLSMLPRTCNWDRIGVSVATFYVREWVRYPAYLCYSYYEHPVHVRVDGYCERCAAVYDVYRQHASRPYEIIKPRTAYKSARSDYARIKRVGDRDGVRPGRALDRATSRRPVTRGTRIVSSEQRRRSAISVPQRSRAVTSQRFRASARTTHPAATRVIKKNKRTHATEASRTRGASAKAKRSRTTARAKTSR